MKERTAIISLISLLILCGILMMIQGLYPLFAPIETDWEALKNGISGNNYNTNDFLLFVFGSILVTLGLQILKEEIK